LIDFDRRRKKGGGKKWFIAAASKKKKKVSGEKGKKAAWLDIKKGLLVGGEGRERKGEGNACRSPAEKKEEGARS